MQNAEALAIRIDRLELALSDATLLLEAIWTRETKTRRSAERAWLADISPYADAGPPKWHFMSDDERERFLGSVRVLRGEE